MCWLTQVVHKEVDTAVDCQEQMGDWQHSWYQLQGKQKENHKRLVLYLWRVPKDLQQAWDDLERVTEDEDDDNED